MAVQPISKSTFLQYQICPKDTWLRLHKPDVIASYASTEFEKHLMEQGNEVEAHARQLFPGAVLVTGTGDDAVAETRRLVEAGTDTILQATFLADGFYAKCDVLKHGAAEATWNIYEIKGTNSRKEGSEDRDHVSDLAFQKRVLTLARVTVDRALVVHLNKEYVRSGALDIPALFVIADSTELVEAALPAVTSEMQGLRRPHGRRRSAGCDGGDRHESGRYMAARRPPDRLWGF